MCGIAGIYRLGDRPPGAAEIAEDRALVERMLRAIAYRGPDDVGIESRGRATLGVRRLAILDVAGGHQPLSDAEGRVWAIQNGEIYNSPELRKELAATFAFRTHTDTELLPHLWLRDGARGVEKLRGMFAYATYDTRDESLFLARDPLGVKPLYLAEVGDRLLFASEIKALLCDPVLARDLDASMVARYLALGFVPGARTVFRAIRRLRPGCRLTIRPGFRSEDRYWHWPRFFDAPPASPEEVVDEVARRLADSAESMLLSDRPLGVLLSGGVDSSVLVALLPEAVRRETRTFTVGFADGGHHDERAIARRVAEHLGTRHHESTVDLDVASELARVVAFLDEPCADPAAVPAHRVARAAAGHVTVLLSGTGGDEIFGGYRRYRLPELLGQAAWMPRALAAAGARWLAEGAQHRKTRGGERSVMIRKLLEARRRPRFLDAYLSTLEPATPERWREALALEADPVRAADDLWSELVAERGAAPASPEETAFAIDHQFYLPDDLLLKEDRMTMGASVEGRVPFLDAGLVSYAAGLPLASRFDGNSGKAVLRKLASRLLPADVATRPKHGFSVPIEDWLRGPLDSLAGDLFASAGSGVFRTATLKKWHTEHRAGRDRAGALWAALTWELWWREIASASPAALAEAGRPLAERV